MPEQSMKDKYRGYAFTKLKETRKRMAEELERDRPTKDDEYVERAEARLASYDDLITAIETIKKVAK